MGRKADKERNEKIVAQVLRGESYGDVASRLGISRSVVAGVIYRAGLTDSANPSQQGAALHGALALDRAVDRACVIGLHAAAVEAKIPPGTIAVRGKKRGLKFPHIRPGGSLSDDDVRAIRTKRRAGAKLRELSAQYGIATSTICAVASGRLYSRVA